MGVYNPDRDGVREPAKKKRYLAVALKQILALDVDTLRDMVVKGEPQFLLWASAVYGANGFSFFTNEDYRAMFCAIEKVSWQKHRADQAENNRLDRMFRTKLTPSEQMREYERKHKAATPAKWH